MSAILSEDHVGVTSEEASPLSEMPNEAGPVIRFVGPVTRYTRFVMFSRRFLWVLIAGIVVLVVWIAAENTSDEGARMVFSNGEGVEEGGENVMVKPHYQGVDAHNQPYTVTADTATQKDENTIALVAVRADLMQNDGTWLAMNAGEGELNSKTKKLNLSKGVTLFYEGGYEFRSDHAFVDIKEGTAYGESPVEGQGPTATLKADGFSVAKRGDVLRFNGSVRMTLYP